MRVFVLIALLSTALSSIAQTDFCLPGARWMYEDGGSSANAPNQIHVVYLGDTILNGFDNVKVLKVENRINWFDFNWEYQEFLSYAMVRNDSVFQYADGEFRLVYDFDVQEGDQRTVYIGGSDLCSTIDTMEIDSIRITEYQGMQLKTYYYHFLIDDQLSPVQGYYDGGGGGSYMERIGFSATHPTYLNIYCWSGNVISEYHHEWLVCYTDNELAGSYPDTCNLFLSSNEERVRDLEFTSYGNQLQIQSSPNSTLHIYDLLGKQLFQDRISSDKQSFDISHLPSGILIVVVETEDQRLVKKILNPY